METLLFVVNVFSFTNFKKATTWMTSALSFVTYALFYFNAQNDKIKVFSLCKRIHIDMEYVEHNG